MLVKTEDDKNIYYEISGNTEAGKTLIFLNGLSQSTVAWALLLPLLKNNFRIICLDFIFQGQSDKTGPVRDFDQHARDVKKVMDETGVSQAILCGISYGSLVGQHFAVNHPERLDKLILMAGFSHKTPIYDAIELSWHRALDAGGYGLMLDVMLPYVLSDHYFSNPLIPIDLMKEGRKDLNPDPAALKKLMIATMERKDYRPELQKIQQATLVIHGEKDLLFSVDMGKSVADNIKNSRFEIIKNAGHTLNIEAPKQLAQLILNFCQ